MLPGWLWWLAGGVGVAWYMAEQTGGAEKLGCRGPSDRALAEAVAKKWGPVFGASFGTMLSISKIESGFRATCVNVNSRAMSRGGAWGMYQMTLETAKGHAAALASSTNPQVRATLSKWNGSGTSLLDPDLCGMFAARQLGNLEKKYKNPDLVAAAYHSGEKPVIAAQQAGVPVTDKLGPYGKVYVAMARKARSDLGVA